MQLAAYRLYMSSIDVNPDVNSLLTKFGLLCHTFAFNDLPSNIKDKLGDENRERFQDGYLSLIANAGPTFWTTLKAKQSEWSNNSEALNNPVDHFSAQVTEQLLQLTGLTTHAELLYPGTAPAPLVLLGELANWSTPSPLGLGLHSRYGPWIAYRALVKTSSPLQTQSLTKELASNDVNSSNTDSNRNNINAATSPCLSCASIACVSACPSNAVSDNASFDIGRCANYRLKENSICKEQCHARNACPVGVEYRFSEEQRAYHMTRAMQALAKWANTD